MCQLTRVHGRVRPRPFQGPSATSTSCVEWGCYTIRGLGTHSNDETTTAAADACMMYICGVGPAVVSLRSSE